VARLLDVAAAAETTAETIRRRYPDRSITVVASGSPHIVIDGDDFADALGNLIENAVRYAPDSEIAVSASSHAGTAVVTVSDRGPGIAPEDRERIFERFYRGRGHDGKDGLGLGLAIVRGVAGRWGGTASVESVLGRTVFRLAFPVAVEEAQALAG
jgi:signal transduction histidine kinase